MDLLKPIKAIRKKVKIKVETSKEKSESERMLSDFIKEFEKSRDKMNPNVYDDREAVWMQTRIVDRNVNSGDTPRKAANNIYNITHEFIEAQVNSQIPQPNVRSKRKGFEPQATMIQESIANSLKEIDVEEVNDYNERMTPLHGFSVMTLDWNPDFKHHLYRGEELLSSKHPKQIVPQPGVYDLQKMDYFFIASGVTKQYIKRRYGKDVETDGQEYPEYNSLDGRATTINTYQPKGLTAVGSGTITNDDIVTEIVKWYRDEDGDIGKFVWCNRTVLEHLPKFFKRRLSECRECGHKMPQGMKECPECGSKKLKTITTDMQELDRSVITGDGEELPAGTEIPYFTPTRYPVIIRKNVPRSFSFEGASDADVIRDQQDSIKKAGTKLEEKELKSGHLILIPEDLKVGITTETYQTIKGTLAQLQAIQTKELKAPLGDTIEYIEEQRRVAQRMLGITDSYLGLQDVTAQSGRAKQIQVQQASGRMQSKLFNKITAFKELFEIMFEFRLAFYDELRPYISKGQNGEIEFGEFDKYKFIQRDAAGELYYNTDFIFSADSGDGLPKDPMFIMDQANAQLKAGIINKVQYWTILEGLNFPNAAMFKQQAIKEQQAMEQNGPPPTDGQLKVEAQKEMQSNQQQFELMKQANDQRFELIKQQDEQRYEMNKQTLDNRNAIVDQLLQNRGNAG